MTDAPTGSNPDEWALFLSECGTADLTKAAIEAAEQRGYARGIEAARTRLQLLRDDYAEVGEWGGCTALDDADEVLHALSPTPPDPVTPKVKPLMWEDGKFKHRNGATYTKRGYSSHGPYYANEDCWCGPGVEIDYVSPGTDVIDYVNQIHEARVLSQIDMAPVTVPEAAIIVADAIDADMTWANRMIEGYVNVTMEMPAKHWFLQILRALAEQEGE